MKHLYQVMPDLSSEEYAVLKADIDDNGLQVPVDVDEDDQTIDGFHRRQVCEELGIECQKRVLTGLTEAQKREHAYRMNLMRRHLSKAQKREIAGKLRLEGWTQDAIAKNLDSSQSTISRWIDQYMQTHKLPQPDRIRGKDGRAYPSSREREPSKRQAEGADTAELASMSPTPSQDSSTDARQAEEIEQQDTGTASDIKPERSLAEDAGIESEAADLPNASSPANRTTSAAEGETAAAPIRALPAAWVDDSEEQSWVCGLEVLSAQVQALQGQDAGPRLSVHWQPETRTRCLDIIRCLKEVMTKWEAMIAPQEREAASPDRNEESNNSASDIRLLPGDHHRHALDEVLPAIGTGQAACPACTARPVAGVSKSRMQDHMGSESSSTEGKNTPLDRTGSPDNERPNKKPPKQIQMGFGDFSDS